MKKLFLFIVLVGIGLASFSFEEVWSYDFSSDISEVERHYFHDRWIYEVRTTDSLHIIVDDTVHSFFLDDSTYYDVVVCTDSVVMVTFTEDSSGRYANFTSLFPDLRESATLPGPYPWNYACIWDDERNEVLYVILYPGLSDPDGGYIEYLRYYNAYYYWSYSLERVEFSHGNIFTGIDYFENYPLLYSCVHIKEPTSWLPRGTQNHEYMYQAISSYSDEMLFIKEELPKGEGSFNHTETGVTHYHLAVQELKQYKSFIGKTLIDIDSDDFVDIPYTRYEDIDCQYWNYDYFGDSLLSYRHVDTVITYSSITSVDSFIMTYTEDGLLLLAYFLGGEVPVLVLDNTIYYGDEFSTSAHLEYFPPVDMDYCGLTDLDMDGVHELYTIEGRHLKFYNLSQSMSLSPGWNLRTPMTVEADSAMDRFIPTSEPAYVFDPASGDYAVADFFRRGLGHFILSLSDTTIMFYGPHFDAVDLSIHPGWNLVGGPSHAISAEDIFTTPALIPPLYIHNSATNSYDEADQVSPGQGFWLLSRDSLVLEVD